MSGLVTFLEALAAERFYGSVEVKFEAGRVVIVRKNETLRLEDLSREIRGATIGKRS